MLFWPVAEGNHRAAGMCFCVCVCGREPGNPL